jgi:photosystem II stability/assembly factor-like uncharacterized protein
MKKIILIALFLAISNITFCQWQNTSTDYNSNDISFINSNTGFFIPSIHGRVYKTTDKGNTWTNIYNGPSQSPSWNSIHFLNENLGFISCKDIIVKLENGVATTVLQYPANNRLHKIRFVNNNTGYALYHKTGYDLNRVDIYKTTNGGNNWDPKQSNIGWQEGYNFWLLDMDFDKNDPDKIYICGYLTESLNEERHVLISTTDGFTSATTVKWGISNENNNRLDHISILGNGEIRMLGNKGVFKQDLTRIWEYQNPNAPHSANYGMTFKDNNTGYIALNNGTIMKTTNGGNNWEFETTISYGSSYLFSRMLSFNEIVYYGSAADNSFSVRALSTNLSTNHDNLSSSGTLTFDNTQYNTPSTQYLRGGVSTYSVDNILNAGQSNEKVFYKWFDGYMEAGRDQDHPFYFDSEGLTISANYKTKFLSTSNTAISHSPQTKALKDTIINGNGTVHQIHESMGGIFYSRSTNNGTSFSREEVVNNIADGNKNAFINVMRAFGSENPITFYDANRNVAAVWERYNSATGKIEIKVASRVNWASGGYVWNSNSDYGDIFTEFDAPVNYESKPKVFISAPPVSIENLNTHVILVPHLRPNGSQNKIIVTARYNGQVQDFEIDNGNISDLAVSAPYNSYGEFYMYFAYKKDNKIAYMKKLIGKDVSLGLHMDHIDSNPNISEGDHGLISQRYTPDISIMNNVPVVTYLGYYNSRRHVVYEEYGPPEPETIALNYYPVIKVERNPDTGIWERRNIYNSNGFNTQQNPNIEGSKTTKSYLLNFSINNNTHKQFVGVAGSNGNYQAGYVVNPGIFYGTDAKLMRGSYEGLTGANSDPSLLTLSPESPLYRVGKRSLTITNNQVYDLDNFNNMVGVVEIEGVTYGFNLGPIIVKGLEIEYEIGKEPEAIQTAIEFNDNLRSEPFLLNENDTLLLGTSAVYLPIEYMPPYFQTIKYDVNLINKETDELHRILFSGEITQEDSVEIEFLRGFIINDINNGSDSFYVKIDVDPEDINGADIYAVNFGINPNDDSGGDNPGSNGKIKIVFEDGNTPANISNNIPDNYSLSQNYPNPFNPVTKISFDLPKDGLVKLMIYDITGRLISTLVNEMKTAGSHNVTFDGSSFSSGVYFYRLEATGFVQTRRMLLIK